jgi:tetratricopeptide (TPR) repeat protein
MKAKILLILFFGISHVSMCQNAQITNAQLYLEAGEYNNAVESIEAATHSIKTTQWAKAWYYRGVVWEEVALKQVLGFDWSLALDTAIYSFHKAMEVDTVKHSFEDQIKQRYLELYPAAINTGAGFFRDKNYYRALIWFEKAIPLNSQDSVAMQYAFYSAQAAGDTVKLLLWGNQLIEKHWANREVLDGLLFRYYYQEKSVIETERVCAAALKRYPNDRDYRALQLLCWAEMPDKAAREKQLIQEANNPIATEDVGLLYIGMKNEAEADTWFRKALTLNSNLFYSHYELGYIGLKKSIQTMNTANSLSDAEYKLKGKAMIESGKSQMQEAYEHANKSVDLATSKEQKRIAQSLRLEIESRLAAFSK